jgi:lipopolysaccharide export system permease protein
MRLLDRYIARNVIVMTLTVMFVLLAIFSFFAFIDELEEIGRGSYGIIQVIVYVSMRTPALAYELFPMAALIGSLLGLGALVRNGEITVVRCSGVSKPRVVVAVMKAAVVFVVLAMVIGELIAPPSDRFARQYRSLAINDQIALKTENGFWARDENSYINIRGILPGDRLEDIYIYEFDGDDRLRISTHARTARYVDSQWILEDISQSILDGNTIDTRSIERAAWDSLLKPDLITVVAVQPDTLSIWTLVKYITFLRSNGQSAQRYEHALWVKITYPIATAVMVFLAIPMVMDHRRTASASQGILVGGLVGLGFHLLNQAAGHLGIVYEFAPAISAAGPALLMFLVASVLLLRTT